MFKVLYIILTLISLVTYFYVLRYNMHMFQLNGYKNGEHFNWIKKNSGKERLLILEGLYGILLLFLCNIVTLIIGILIQLIVIKYYLYLKRSNTKKKLVYTKRVQRMIISDVIISLLILCVIGFINPSSIIGGLFILTALHVVYLIFINTVNKPVEAAVNRYFINDARKKLNSVKDILVIGITGSYGKTSVKYYLHTLLREHFNVLITPESYNTPMGVVRTIREHLKPTDQIFICEMGARHVGDIKEICDIVNPKHGVITSVGPQHLETFFNMDNIKKTKFELADALPDDGILFVNGDNEYINEYVTETLGKYNNMVFYRNNSRGEGYTVKNVTLSSKGTEFKVISPEKEEETFNTRLVGEHNIINIVGAIAVANTLGVKLKDLKVGVRRIQPVEHRMQLLEKGGGVTIIDDAYNSNPVGSKAAVETLNMFEGLKILVTPGMVELGDKEDEYNYKFGTYAAENCDYILLVGKKHTEPIYNGVVESGFDKDKVKSYDTLEEALSFAYSINSDMHKYILLENDLPDNY